MDACDEVKELDPEKSLKLNVPPLPLNVPPEWLKFPFTSISYVVMVNVPPCITNPLRPTLFHNPAADEMVPEYVFAILIPATSIAVSIRTFATEYVLVNAATSLVPGTLLVDQFAEVDHLPSALAFVQYTVLVAGSRSSAGFLGELS